MSAHIRHRQSEFSRNKRMTSRQPQAAVIAQDKITDLPEFLGRNFEIRLMAGLWVRGFSDRDVAAWLNPSAPKDFAPSVTSMRENLQRRLGLPWRKDLERALRKVPGILRSKAERSKAPQPLALP